MAKAFKFSTGRAARGALPRSTRAQVLRDEKEMGPYYVRGIKAGSKEEYWVSLALTKIEEETGWAWEYQVPVYGGRKYAGGNVIDFLLHTPGRYTMIQPEGRYWHTGKNEDMHEMEQVARKKNWNLIVWFTDETPDKDSVLSLLRNRLGV